MANADMYSGPLSPPNMEPIPKKAYCIWNNQKQRCSPASGKKYDLKNYFMKGVRVEYSSREFITWFIKEYESWAYKSDIVVGRIDHDKNYSLDNIRLETRQQGFTDPYLRHDNPFKLKQKSVIFLSKNKRIKFDSQRSAARALSIDHVRLFVEIKKRNCSIFDESELLRFKRPFSRGPRSLKNKDVNSDQT